MTKSFHSAKTDMTENEVMENANAYYEEVASNVYAVRKSRLNSDSANYVDGTVIANELNKSDSRVAVKTLSGKMLLNFSRIMYKRVYENTLNREII